MGWKEEYDSYVLKYDRKNMIKIKNEHLPCLYKYRSFDENGYWKEWVKGNAIATPPLKFNDPFDSIINYGENALQPFIKDACKSTLKRYLGKLKTVDKNRIDLSENPLESCLKRLEMQGIKIDREIFNKDVFKASLYVNELRKNLLVTSYSEINDSILMWSHYSNNHQGFCIEYDFKGDDSYNQFLFPVTYSQNRKIINENEILKDGWALTSVLCKSTVWSYEKEWRYTNAPICCDVNKHIYRVNISKSIKGIYLGACINDDNLKLITDIAKEKNIPIYKMKMSDNEYKLISEKI